MKSLLPLGLLLLAPALHAAVPLTGSGTFTETFNALPSAAGTEWNDGTTLPNWYLHRSNAAAPVPIPVLINDNVAATAWTAGLYSLGATGGTDRALGSAPTGTLGEFSHILILHNTSAQPVQLTGIAYAVEKWRENSTAGITERIDFSYQKGIDEASLVSSLGSGWINEDNLDTAVPHSGTASAVHNPGLAFPINQAPVNPIVLEAGGYAALRWQNSNESGSDAYLGIDDVAVTWSTVNAAISATPQDIVRNTKGTPAPGDDTFSFVLPITGIGSVSAAGWQLTAALPAGWTGPASGAYGDMPTYAGIPVSAPSVSLTLRDKASAGITRTITVTTPPVPANLTATSGPLEVRFTAPAAGSTFFTRSYTDGLTDLGWTSNAPANGFNGVSTRPTGGDPNHYFRIRNAKLNRFQTEPVNIEAFAGVDVSLQLGAYTTSNTGFEDGPAAAITFAGSDRVQALVEASADGVVWTAATPSLVSTAQTGVAQFTDFRIADPGINYTADTVTPSTLPAVIPFPATRTLRFNRGSATMVRLALLGGNDSDTENTLFDNIKFAAIPPAITAALSNAVRNNQGDDNAANDTFTFSLAVNNDDTGRPQGWKSDVPGFNGLYSPTPVPFPTYPVSSGARLINFTDAANPLMTLAYTVPVPIGVLTAGAPVVVRNEGATPAPADDTWSFSVAVTAVNGGTGYLNNLTAASANYGTAVSFGPFPVSAGPQSIIFHDRSNASWTTTASFTPPIRPVLATVSTGGPVSLVYSSVSPVITGWTEGASQGVLVQVNGGGTLAHVLQSDLVDLSAVNGPVRFRADFTAADSSATTNFETSDTFKIELDFARPSGITRINLLTASEDTGDGAASSGPNGSANGVLNGFTGIADTAAAITAIQDYDSNRERDEFNLPVNDVRAGAAPFLGSSFQFTTLIPDDVTAARLLVTGLNNSATESFTVSGMNFVMETIPAGDSDGDGASDQDEQTAGTNPHDPADFLRIAGFQAVPASNPRSFSSTFRSRIGRFYHLYRSTNLQAWTAEGGTFTGDGGDFDVFTQPPANVTRVYYRLMVRTTDSFPVNTP